MQAPDAYVLAQATSAGADSWLGDLLRSCYHVLGQNASLQIVDEETTSANGGSRAAVVKISERLSAETLAALAEELCKPNPWFSARLVKAVQPNQFCLALDDVTLTYFRKEFVRDSMIHHTDCCVRLVHIPTGISARSTDHRSRFMNQMEAQFLLETLVMEVRGEA
jgi:hypothetical protein